MSEQQKPPAPSQLPELEITCPECEGKCYWEKRGRCQTCHGNGVVPTEFGKQVLSLVRHNKRVILLDDEN